MLCLCGVEGAWSGPGDIELEAESGGAGATPPTQARCLADADPPSGERISTGDRRLDRLLAGGWAPGRTTVLHGPAGSGKTTHALAWAPRPVLVISLEMAADLLRATAERAGVPAGAIFYVTQPSGWERAAERHRARAVVLDSATVAGDDVGATRAVVDYCRARGAVGVVVTHENKRGQVAGPGGVVYWADAELLLRRPRPDKLRARLKKCRWAPAPASAELRPRDQAQRSPKVKQGP